DRDRDPEPRPPGDPLAEPEVREEDRDERLRLLQEQRLDEVAVAERDREQYRGEGGCTDADRDDRSPLRGVQAADLAPGEDDDRQADDRQDDVLHRDELSRLQ